MMQFWTIDICKGIVTEVEKKIGMDVMVEYVPVTADGRFKWIGKFTRKRLPIFDAMVKLNATPE